MHLKHINLSNINNYFLYYTIINNKKLFILKKNDLEMRYLTIPFGVNFFKKDNNILLFSNLDYNITFFSFYNSFKKFLREGFKTYIRKLILKGLGYRININAEKDKKLFKFKLGFSHFIEFPIDDKISFKLKKNMIFITGTDLNFISNFSRKIKDLKKPNIYHGKGFWYKNENIKLKTFKKKK